jgi:hypothetical protein
MPSAIRGATRPAEQARLPKEKRVVALPEETENDARLFKS